MTRIRPALFTAVPPLAVAILAGCSSASSAPAGQVTPLPMAQVPTVAQVASAVHASGVTSCGRAILGGVVRSGTAYLGSERIGIDIFAATSARNAWKTIAESNGVQPFAEGADWVAYRALSQSGPACS